MDIHNLVTMANRIGDFFESMPNQTEARESIVNHLSRYWEPRMREALIAQLQTPATQDLHVIVRQAVEENLVRLARKTAN